MSRKDQDYSRAAKNQSKTARCSAYKDSIEEMANEALKQADAHNVVLIAPWLLDVIDTVTNGYDVDELIVKISQWYDRFIRHAWEEDKTVIIFHQVIDISEPEMASIPSYRLNLKRNNDYLDQINNCLNTIEETIKWKCSHKFAAIQFYINQEMDRINGIHFSNEGLAQIDRLVKVVVGKGKF